MYPTSHVTQAFIHLDHITHNVRLLQELVGKRPLWPVIKANAYGHDAVVVGRHLVALGYTTLCVAHVAEAARLLEAGVQATLIVLSATLPEHSEWLVAHDCEPVVCTLEMVERLNQAAIRAGKGVAVHLKVDTGMGRIGIWPEAVTGFLDRCRALPAISVKGLMSHLPHTQEPDCAYSAQQIATFRWLRDATRRYGIGVYHLASSAAIFDLPQAAFDAVRPGIAIYGLAPSAAIRNPSIHRLKPVLEWKTRITYLKEVPAGTGLSYEHMFETVKTSLIATIPLGYGDGLSQRLSNQLEMLVGGIRCAQVGRICMDQCLLDVTPLSGRVAIGDEVVMIGRQGDADITAEELATQLGTINYEIVAQIAARVPRLAIGSNANRPYAMSRSMRSLAVS
jgi:alanine racemase